MQLFDGDEWRTVNYNGVVYPEYEAHQSGVVRRAAGAPRHSVKTGAGGGTPGKALKPKAVNAYGHSCVQLYKDGVRKSALIHRVIASTFIEEYRPEWQVHHIDHDPTNNALENLYCCPEWLHDEIHKEMLKVHKMVIASIVRLSKMARP